MKQLFVVVTPAASALCAVSTAAPTDPTVIQVLDGDTIFIKDSQGRLVLSHVY